MRSLKQRRSKLILADETTCVRRVEDTYGVSVQLKPTNEASSNCESVNILLRAMPFSIPSQELG